MDLTGHSDHGIQPVPNPSEQGVACLSCLLSAF